MATTGLITSVINWLRAGYPQGVPQRDYLPLFALLATQLSDEDARFVADELALTSAPDDAEVIRDAISKFTHDRPLDSDVARVRARLAEGGWPLARPDGI
jgi:hypothetical protein